MSDYIDFILDRWQRECYGWSISVNDNKTYGDTAKSVIADRESVLGDRDEPLGIEPDVRAKMEELNQYVCIQVYPNNSIGSYEVFHYNLLMGITEMEKILIAEK